MSSPLDRTPPVLLSLGSINADLQMRIDEAAGQKETLPAHDLLRLSGGKAANRAFLARLLGHESRLLGRVGDDDLASQALAPLREAGVDVAGVQQGPPGTAISIITVPPDGKKRIVLAGRSNRSFSADDIAKVAACIDAAPAGSVLAVDFEVSPEAAREAGARARRRGLRVVADPSFPSDIPAEALRDIDALTPNVEEAFALAGVPGETAHDDRETLEQAARALAARGPQCVCIKLDDGGCLLLHEGRCWHQQAAPEDKVVDTTGAGDAFTGAFAVALLEGRDAREAARYGVTAGEIAVSTYGFQPAYPRRNAFMARLALPRRCEPWGASGGQGPTG